MGTKIMILQLCGLDANSFFSATVWKQTKNCKSISETPIKILGTQVLQGRMETGSTGIFYSLFYMFILILLHWLWCRDFVCPEPCSNCRSSAWFVTWSIGLLPSWSVRFRSLDFGRRQASMSHNYMCLWHPTLFVFLWWIAPVHRKSCRGNWHSKMQNKSNMTR